MTDRNRVMISLTAFQKEYYESLAAFYGLPLSKFLVRTVEEGVKPYVQKLQNDRDFDLQFKQRADAFKEYEAQAHKQRMDELEQLKKMGVPSKAKRIKKS